MSDGANRAILVVDDDIFSLQATSLLLNEFGYHVVACGDARDALERLRRLQVDAVLTDIVMPGVSGIDLLVKVHDTDPDIPVILMTGQADMDKTIDAIKKGAFDFMIKPYKPEQLLHSVEKALKYTALVRVEKEYRRILEEFSQNIESLVAERTTNLMALAVADRVRNP
jgi:putative two-component system response regulator